MSVLINLFRSAGIVNQIIIGVSFLLFVWASLWWVVKIHDMNVIKVHESEVKNKTENKVLKDVQSINKTFSSDNDNVLDNVKRMLSEFTAQSQLQSTGSDPINASGFSGEGANMGAQDELHFIETYEQETAELLQCTEEEITKCIPSWCCDER